MSDKNTSPIYAIRKYGLRSFVFNTWSILTSDYVVVSFQKCGKTWLRMMLSKIISEKYNIKNIKLDLQEMTLFTAAPNILISHAGSTKENNKIDFTKIFKNKKIIFLVRDPRDIVVSLFHGSRTRDMVYSGDDISVFIRDDGHGFKKIVDFMNTWSKEFSKRPHDFIMVKYGDMRKNTAPELRRILEFMNIGVDDDLINRTVEYGSFNNMRKMEMKGEVDDYRMRPGNVNDPNSFRTRKGKVGGYREELSEVDIQYVDNYVREKLAPSFGYN
tara:strand:- start:28397 stop:29212 length:816 start_codon:yes stop_codon:yes gene_type:complete